MLLTDLSAELRAKVEESGLTRRKLGDMLGMSDVAITHTITRQLLDDDTTWIRLLDVLGYDVKIHINKKR